MTPACHLADARRALVEGRPQDCAQALAAFEAAVDLATAPPEDMAHLQAELVALGLLTRAALDGVADARDCLVRAVREAGRLSTYAADGQREDRDLRQSAPRRY